MKSTSFKEEQYFRSLPQGVWFDPNDHELIEGYLIRKINGLKLPRNRIKHVDLYSYSTPENLIENYELITEKAWFFFTSRNKKYMNGKRLDRSTSGGVWRATIGEAEIRNNDNIVVGYKQVLKFFAKNPNYHHQVSARTDQWISTDWLMHEYRVNDYNTTMRRSSSINGDAMKLDECILCKVYKKSEQIKKREANKSSKSTNNKRAQKLSVNADEFHQRQPGSLCKSDDRFSIIVDYGST